VKQSKAGKGGEKPFWEEPRNIHSKGEGLGTRNSPGRGGGEKNVNYCSKKRGAPGALWMGKNRKAPRLPVASALVR